MTARFLGCENFRTARGEAIQRFVLRIGVFYKIIPVEQYFTAVLEFFRIGEMLIHGKQSGGDSVMGLEGIQYMTYEGSICFFKIVFEIHGTEFRFSFGLRSHQQ